jgi:hypothetical protein
MMLFESILSDLRALRQRLGLHPVWPATYNRLMLARRMLEAEMGVFERIEL